MEEIRYNYSINPRKRIITEYSILKNVRSPKTLMLTKKEVVDALKSCLVYRRFDTTTIKKVNLMNLDRMHQATYDPTLEQEFKPISFEEDTMVEEKKEETPKKETEIIKPTPSLVETIKEPVVEPVKYDITAPVEVTTVSDPIPVVEDIKEDTEIENQPIVEPVDDGSIVEEQPIEVGETVEESIPDVIEPTVEIEENKEYTQNNNNKKYNNNNKKHH